MTLTKGARVRIVRDVENYPAIYLKAGATGCVTDVEKTPHRETYIHVLLDARREELEDEWQNVLAIYDDGSDPAYAAETFVTEIPLTVADLETMVANGKPDDHAEWGSERQILASNMVPIAMEHAGFVFSDEQDSWCLKATIDEILDADLRWFREWQASLDICRKWVARLGGGFHPDTRDYDPPLSPQEASDYERDMDKLFANGGDPYAYGLQAMKEAGLIEGAE